MKHFPFDILRLISEYDLCIKFSTDNVLKPKYQQSDLYYMLLHGFTDLFQREFNKFKYSLYELEDMMELTIIYKDTECLELLKAKLSGRLCR